MDGEAERSLREEEREGFDLNRKGPLVVRGGGEAEAEAEAEGSVEYTGSVAIVKCWMMIVHSKATMDAFLSFLHTRKKSMQSG